jgi:hypothetical protein
MSEYIMKDGGEVYTEQHDDCRVYDRIILTEGFAVCINKQAYQQDVYSQENIKSIHCHTQEHEDKEWW